MPGPRKRKPSSLSLVVRLLVKKDIPKEAVRLPGGPKELVALAFLRVGKKAITVGKADLREMALTPAELAELAIAGLKDQVPVEVREVGNGIVTVSNDEIPFVSGYALALGEVPGLPRLGKNGALVAFPNAHLMIVRPMQKRGLESALQAMMPGIVGTFLEGPSPLTPDLYWVRGDEWMRIRVEIKGHELRIHMTEEFEKFLEG